MNAIDPVYLARAGRAADRAEGRVNAIAPPPKRRHGTGTISFHRLSRKWRYRLPGGQIECGGYDTMAEAEAALAEHLAGHNPKLTRLRKHLRIALDLAAVIGVSVDSELASARSRRLIEWARARRRAGNNERGAP